MQLFMACLLVKSFAQHTAREGLSTGESERQHGCANQACCLVCLTCMPTDMNLR